MDLTAETVTTLAPDAKVASAGKRLGAERSWQSLGRSPEALWGECRGSAIYQTRVDLSDLSVKCSCPSRKQPCKHGIGLLFLALDVPPPETPAPDWVSDWLARRAARANAQPTARKGDRAEDAVDPGAREKRTKKRLSRVATGLDALDLWMEDLVRGGLAAAGMKPNSYWEAQAKRMVDAQAPGIAARLRRLSEFPNSSPDWPERLLDGLGRLALLTEAFRRLDALEDPLAHDVRGEVGISFTQQEVLDRGETVGDAWIVIGQRIFDEGRLKARRTWLLGASTRCYALILQFAAAGSPFAESFVSGSVQQANLAFYPSAYPLRAVVKDRSGPTKRAIRLPGHETIEALLDDAADAAACQPWLERIPAALSGVVPIPATAADGGRWMVRDGEGDAVPLAGGDHRRLLSLSGGNPVDLGGEWDETGFLPLGIVADGAYRVLAEEA